MFKTFVFGSMSAAAVLAMSLIFTVSGQVPRGKAHTDRYAFGHDLVITEPVAGTVQIFSGSADVRSPISGDLVVFGGDVSFAEGGVVFGNLIHAGGAIRNGEGRIRGRIQSLSTLEGAAASVTQRAVVLSLLLVWLVVAVVLALISGREIRVSSQEIRASALYCLALGLVAVTSFVLTAIVFSYLVPFVVGIPLLAALAALAILTKVYGMVAVFHAVGTVIAGAKTRDQLASRKWFRGDLAMIVVGLLVLGILRLIPVVGVMIWSMASIFGIGVALATRFGRRDPWFLVWRPAEAYEA